MNMDPQELIGQLLLAGGRAPFSDRPLTRTPQYLPFQEPSTVEDFQRKYRRSPATDAEMERYYPVPQEGGACIPAQPEMSDAGSFIAQQLARRGV
jgi:hypothetical protein